VTKADVTM